jgi:hypothetical protein
MPEKKTLQRARRAKRAGKAPTTQAGEFVREEMEHVQEGKHGVKSRKQAIAIGLSKARRSGVKIPARGKAAGAKRSTRGGSARTKTSARRKPAASKRTAARKPAGAKRTAARRKPASRARAKKR